MLLWLETKEYVRCSGSELEKPSAIAGQKHIYALVKKMNSGNFSMIETNHKSWISNSKPKKQN